MAQFGQISARGRAMLLILAVGAGAMGAGVARSLAPASAAGALSVQLTTNTPTVVTGHVANLTARVLNGGTAPTGSVTFSLDGAAITPASAGTKNLTGGKNSVAANFTMNSAGAHQFTARYTGSAGTATSAPLTVNVVQAGTGTASVTIASSLGTTVPSATPLILTAHVSGTPMPTGSVSFSDSLTALPSNRALTNGAVSINVNSLPLGTNTITASYSGD
ncbi:MAG: Ig-like domain repeat protein, partial [Chloroflexi bacterium]